MTETAAARNEDCRRCVRAHLAARPAVAQCAATIARGLRAEWDFSADEVLHACLFLAGLGHLAEEPDPLSSLRYFRATPAGILAAERD